MNTDIILKKMKRGDYCRVNFTLTHHESIIGKTRHQEY